MFEQRGTVIADKSILDNLPPDFLAVKSWADRVSPIRQKKVRDKIRELGWIAESVFVSSGIYRLQVYKNWDERSAMWQWLVSR